MRQRNLFLIFPCPKSCLFKSKFCAGRVSICHHHLKIVQKKYQNYRLKLTHEVSLCSGSYNVSEPNIQANLPLWSAVE
jgi:hypothetical protein